MESSSPSYFLSFLFCLLVDCVIWKGDFYWYCFSLIIEISGLYSCLEKWTEEPDELQSMGSLRVRHDWTTSLSRIGEGNGNPLQCSCLEDPRDGGAWWAAIYGVTQSRTRLKRLSSSRVVGGASQVAQWWSLSANTGGTVDIGSTPGSGRSPGGGNGHPLQYSYLENPRDKGA